MTGFKTAHDFRIFSDLVRRERRFFYSELTSNFLSVVGEAVKSREVVLRTGKALWRAQIGSRLWNRPDGDSRDELGEVPYPPERMKPPADHTSEGRVNPRGIPFLYLSFDCETAICEVRPWLGALVSVGEFRTTRDLKLADFTKHKGKLGNWDVLLNLPVERWQKLTPDEVEQAVWADIDSAFARPVGPQDEHIDYVPTQIIAELLRHQGFDGVGYRSAMNEGGYNIALFDLGAADLAICHLVAIEKVSYQCSKTTNPWYVHDGQYVTNVITDIRPIDPDAANKKAGE